MKENFNAKEKEKEFQCIGGRKVQWQGKRKQWPRRKKKGSIEGRERVMAKEREKGLTKGSESVMAKERDGPLVEGRPMTSYNKKE